MRRNTMQVSNHKLTFSILNCIQSNSKKAFIKSNLELSFSFSNKVKSFNFSYYPLLTPTCFLQEFDYEYLEDL